MSAEEESNTTAAAAPAPAPTKKKATNSYYYWHGHEKERAAVGDVAPLPTPVLVKTDDPSSANAAALRELALRVTTASLVKKYSWSDGNKFVTVYISVADPASAGGDGVTETLDEASVSVEYSKVSFKVSFVTKCEKSGTTTTRTKQLSLNLSKHIDPSKCEVKLRPEKNEIQLKLAKRTVPETWFELVGTAKAEDEDEEGDDGDNAEVGTAESDD